MFSDEIIHWYVGNKRDLPWRSTTNPYLIWVSEIILQQTQVKQGLGYFHRFIEKFPHIFSLNSASEDDVLKVWEGLGYYSRARNMMKTAEIVCNEHGGVFPDTYLGLMKLPGIGPYTAAAISSFCFKLPHPVVDGNVQRVLSRFLGIKEAIDSSKGKKAIQKSAEELMDNSNPDTYNQAIMEFGALICTPKSPKCNKCPLLTSCFAYLENCISELPLKTVKLKRKKRSFIYLIHETDGEIIVNKRSKKDIWQGLYEFPCLEINDIPESEVALNTLISKASNGKLLKHSIIYKHVLTHQDIFAVFCFISKPDLNSPLFQYTECIESSLIRTIPWPKLILNFIDLEFS